MARFAGETATLHRRTDEKGLFTIGYKNDVAKFTPKSAKQCKTSVAEMGERLGKRFDELWQELA